MVCCPRAHLLSSPRPLLGIDIVMFFKCMNALLNRTGTVKWVLVAHTVTMFSVVTVAITTLFNTMHISYIDDRGFPGPPFSGPIGYQLSANRKPVTLIPLVALFLNNWLADGLLVRFVFNSIIEVHNAGHRSSSIAVASFMT